MNGVKKLNNILNKLQTNTRVLEGAIKLRRRNRERVIKRFKEGEELDDDIKIALARAVINMYTTWSRDHMENILDEILFVLHLQELKAEQRYTRINQGQLNNIEKHRLEKQLDYITKLYEKINNIHRGYITERTVNRIKSDISELLLNKTDRAIVELINNDKNILQSSPELYYIYLRRK